MAGIRTAKTQRPFVDASFFSVPTYSSWVRASIPAAEAYPNAAVLYSSSISEPTSDLVQQVREGFSDRLTPRFISVFSQGNHYVTEAICARYGARPNQVITTTGATSALSMALRALAGPGDTVLVERPGFDLLSALALASGASVEPLERPAPLFKVDLEDLPNRLSPRVRAIVITNLHNPSGVHLSSNEILAVAEIAARVGATVIVDEVYADFMRPHHTPAALLAPNIISVNSLTKVFGLFALKCGWMIGAPELLRRVQDESPEGGDYGVSKLSHAVAAHVLESAQVFDQRWQTILAAALPVLSAHVRRMNSDGLIMGDIPQFGCMYFPRIVGHEDTRSLAQLLWERHRILIAPGEFFGMRGHMRLGFGGDAAELDKGLARLHRALLDAQT